MPLDETAEAKLLDDLDGMDGEQWLALLAWMAPTLCRESPRLLMEMVIRRANTESPQLRTHGAVVEKAVNLLSVIGIKLSA